MNKYKVSVVFFVVFLSISLFGKGEGFNFIEKQCPTTPVSTTGAIAHVPPGCFDYYVFAQFWTPETCVHYNDFNVSSDLCAKLSRTFLEIPYPHGLWPNFKTTVPKQVAFPVVCSNEQLDFNKLDNNILQKVEKFYYVNTDLPRHEWVKHGTCDGITQNQFFKKVFRYQDKLSKSRKFLSKFMGKSLPYKDLIKKLGGEGYVHIECTRQGEKQYLNQIWTNFDRKNKPLKVSTDDRSCDTNKYVHIRAFPTYLSILDWEGQVLSNYKEGITVGFDVDDTLLFSSPLFHYLLNYTKLQLDEQKFWDEANKLDVFSLSKKSVGDLLRFHMQRGDEVVIITKRTSSRNEILSKILQKTFNLPSNVNVIFTNGEDKTPFIKSSKIDIYYGDSDGDITSAIGAGAKGVRILRAGNSDNTFEYAPGAFDEIILYDSKN